MSKKKTVEGTGAEAPVLAPVLVEMTLEELVDLSTRLTAERAALKKRAMEVQEWITLRTDEKNRAQDTLSGRVIRQGGRK